MKELALRLPIPARYRGWVSQAAFAALMTVLGAGIVHIVAVLLVPQFAARDGYGRLVAASTAENFTVIDRTAAPGEVLPGLDPLFVHGTCRVDLSGSAGGITFRGDDRPWLMALYDRRNTAVFSLNDRALPEGDLDMLLVTPAQNARLRETAPQRYSEKIVLELDATTYVAIVRVYAPTDGDRADAAALLGGGRCGPTDLAAEP